MQFGENAKRHRFQAVTVLGQPMLFTTAHLDHNTIPKGVYLYAVRHHSEDTECPVQICQWALANRYGSLVTSTPVPLQKYSKFNNSFKDIDPERDWYDTGYEISIKEYLDRFPPKQKPTRKRDDAR